MYVLMYVSLTHATWRVMCQAQVKDCVGCDWGGFNADKGEKTK